jgi:hypothetical protein
MPQCGVMGQAAGAAAALAWQKGSTPRQVNTNELQEVLRKQGCIVKQEDIVQTS